MDSKRLTNYTVKAKAIFGRALKVTAFWPTECFLGFWEYAKCSSCGHRW